MPEEFNQQVKREKALLEHMQGWQIPPVTLTAWPQHPLCVDAGLYRLDPPRARELRDRLPAFEGDSWSVAIGLLDWASTRWTHDGWNEGGDADALELLQRSERGEQFRCVEFATLLVGALDAVGIPARRVALRRSGYSRPEPGMGHVVLEAWIDSFGRWVLLDSQNGAWWEVDGVPQSALELCRAYRNAAKRPAFARFEGTEQDAEVWWSYFDNATVGGNVLCFDQAGCSLTFQQLGWLSFSRVLQPDMHEAAYPSLHHIGVSLNVVEMSKDASKVATLSLAATHVAASGIKVGGEVYPLECTGFELSTAAGDHSVNVELLTPRGSFPVGEIAWTVGCVVAPELPDEMVEPLDI